jgi:acetolactate synthase-1/2/3 large subunit
MPVLFISGQVNTWQLKKTPEQRFNGVQELDIISMVKPITKMNVRLNEWRSDRLNIQHILDDAVTWMREPRQGPVWLDIPLDIQGAEI